jgi:hypothetical protein
LHFLSKAYYFRIKDKREMKNIFLAMPFLQFSKAFFHKKTTNFENDQDKERKSKHGGKITFIALKRNNLT